MTNHIHLIICSDGEKLSDIIRDFKKYTSSKLIKAIENNSVESRKNWLLKKYSKIWFWEEGCHGEEIFTKDFFTTKLDYIHLNPVRAGFVEREEEYVYSSCGDYYGVRKGKLEITYDS